MHKLAFILLVIGGLNWGLTSIKEFAAVAIHKTKTPPHGGFFVLLLMFYILLCLRHYPV